MAESFEDLSEAAFIAALRTNSAGAIPRVIAAFLTTSHSLSENLIKRWKRLWGRFLFEIVLGFDTFGRCWS